MLLWAQIWVSAALSAHPNGPGADGRLAFVHAGPEDLNADTRRQQAAEALAEARRLAAAGSYEQAIDAFERALALRPSPGLHYNVAVCHHRLMLGSDPESAPYERHRQAAVDSYNAYLEGDADAQDRYAVASTVAELGGRPQILDEWRIAPETPPSVTPTLRDDESLWPEGTPDEAPPAVLSDPDEQPPAPPAQAPPPIAPAPRPRRPFPHGAFGLAFAADLQGFDDVRRTSQVSTAPLLGPVLWGRAYLGKQQAFGVGGELAWAMQPDPRTRQHQLATTQFGVTGSWRTTVGPRERIDVGVGALVGLLVQSLRHRGPSTAACRVQDNGVISNRGGVLAALRFQAAVALDAAKRHQVTLRAGPGVASLSEGTTPKGCMPADAFAQYGLDRQPLLFRTDVGYAFRW